jgi:hypothetical protein
MPHPFGHRSRATQDKMAQWLAQLPVVKSEVTGMYILNTSVGVLFTNSIIDHLIYTTVNAFSGTVHHTPVEYVPPKFKKYVAAVLEFYGRGAIPPMHVLLATLVYLSRAEPIKKYFECKDPFNPLFCGALVVAAKVYNPP